MTPDVEPKIVAVTGASGFIGGRLVELLSEQPKPEVAAVRAFARRRNHAGFEILRLDDLTAVDRALAGCHVLVHCAFDFHDLPANLRIVRVLGRVCAARNIRLVLLSSAAVYEPFPEGVFDETAPSEPGVVPYSDTKIAIEREVLGQARSIGLDAVILQPTVVYGPYCRQWTDTPARELLSGCVVLPSEGRGTCNAVHVDDVCAAAIAAMVAEVPSGERLIISGPAPVTWGEFFLALQIALGTGTVSWMSSAETENRRELLAPVANVSAARAIAMRLVSRMIEQKVRTRLKFALQRLRSGGEGIVHSPEGSKFDLYSSRGIAKTAKARRSLGWEPRIDFDQGMVQTAEYLRTAFATEIARTRRRNGEVRKARPAASKPSRSSNGRA